MTDPTRGHLRPVEAPADDRGTWVPLATAEARSGRSRRTLRRMIDRGDLPGELRPEGWYVDPAHVPTGAEAPAGVADGHAAHPAEAPPGTLLVPLDAWNRMLDQLGNLHQAGQELAEARERAARAETEASFLREQVRTLRSALPPPPPPPAEAPPAQVPTIRRRWWQRS